MSFRQLTVQPVAKISSKWWYFRFMDHWGISKRNNHQSKGADHLLTKNPVHTIKKFSQRAHLGIPWNKSELEHTGSDDVMKHFLCYCPFVRGIHRIPRTKGQWRGALMYFFYRFSLQATKDHHAISVYCCPREQFRHAPNQWDTSLHCNDVSHWLGACLNCSLWSLFTTFANFCGNIS